MCELATMLVFYFIKNITRGEPKLLMPIEKYIPQLILFKRTWSNWSKIWPDIIFNF